MEKKIDFDIVLACCFLIALVGGFVYFIYSLKVEKDERDSKFNADYEADRKREPDFKIEKVDDLKNLVSFSFADNKHQFQAKMQKPEQYVWRDFTLKIRDFYENDVFKKIDFQLFKGDKQIAVFDPKIDYRLW